MYYFVRVNGKTTHNNPDEPSWYVEGEPPKYPKQEFNYVRYCLKNGVVRIGWPDVGDLSAESKHGAAANAYDLDSVKSHVRQYLLTFRGIEPGEIILTTDKKTSGLIHIGTVTAPYSYFYEHPKHPYECAHRLGVDWDTDERGNPMKYWSRDLNIQPRGGFWLRAFHVIDQGSGATEIIEAIEKVRANRSDNGDGSQT